jgi:energy-coupling factor transporter ATP-binding protein EcfA2
MKTKTQKTTLRVEKFGPVERAEITFGDLTIFVGPQATGKSIVLQLYKLLLDKRFIQSRLREFNIRWKSIENFLELYFGEGMAHLYQKDDTRIVYNDEIVDFESFRETRGPKQSETLFYIPAQRVLSLREGQTRPFTDYRTGDPFVLREFSEKIHQMVQSEFATQRDFFPQQGRLRKEFRQLLEDAIFAGFQLRSEVKQFQQRFVLSDESGHALPYLVWSAGQREFVPLLLGLYWLLPAGKSSRREEVEWVVIEEPEMGLHPKAIVAVMALVFELIKRGYRVCISTHSSQVLDIIWAIQTFNEYDAQINDVLKLFELRKNDLTSELAKKALEAEIRVYYFKRDGRTEDISRLDPGSSRPEEYGWGGLTEFAAKVNDLVAEVVNRFERQNAHRDVEESV